MKRERTLTITFLLVALWALSPFAEAQTRGYWRFDQGFSSVVPDVSGNGLNGLLVNMNTGIDDGVTGYSEDVPGTLITDGVTTNNNGFSMRFNNTNGGIVITNPASLAIASSDGVTVEAFVKLSSNPPAGNNFYLLYARAPEIAPEKPYTRIMTFFNPGAAGEPHMRQHVVSDLANSSSTIFSTDMTPSPIALHHWHHVAWVRDGTRFRFYVDYQLINEVDQPSQEVGPYSNFNIVQLGAFNVNNSAGNLHGLLDEVRITEGPLAPEQFLRVVGGLPHKIRDIQPVGSDVSVTVITTEGEPYQLQGIVNLSSQPQNWVNLGGVFNGEKFYTILTNPAPDMLHYRAIRNP